MARRKLTAITLLLRSVDDVTAFAVARKEDCSGLCRFKSFTLRRGRRSLVAYT